MNGIRQQTCMCEVMPPIPACRVAGELPLGRFALPSERGSDAGLDKVVLRALERDPARRYQRAT